MSSPELVLHQFIEAHNFLQKPTQQISQFFRENPTCYKVALLVNHIFRAGAMAAFCAMMPFVAPVNLAICFAGSLFYRLTVETNCAYKFALPAFAGSVAIPIGASAISGLISGVAFASLSSLGMTFISLVPLVVYVSYIVLTVNYDVDHH